MPLYVGSSVKDSRPVRRGYAGSLDDIADFLKESAGIPKGDWYWLSVELTDGRRYAEGVKGVYALVVDIDEVMTLDEGRARAVELGHPCVIYTSGSHQKQKDDKPPCDRYRMIFPLSEPVVGSAWTYLYTPLCDYIGVPWDPSCKDPSRLWYAAQDAEHVETLNPDGPLLDPRSVKPLPKESPKTEQPSKTRANKGNGKGRPGDDYAACNSWREILERAGYRYLKNVGKEERYLRSGKDDGLSITAYHNGSENIHVFSSSIPYLEADGNYTKFEFYARCYHCGDREEAARTLAKEGYGDAPHPFIPSRQPEDATYIQGEIEQLSKFEPSDLGNAERFVRLYGQYLRYCHLWGKWLFWSGWGFAQDENGGSIATQKVIEMIRGMAIEALTPERSSEMGKMLEWAWKCHSHARQVSAIAVAKQLKGVPVSPGDMDQNPDLLNLRNGTLNMRTMELREHRREDLLTKLIDIDYDPDAKCPFWLEFINKVLDRDEDLIRYVQKACGYSLSGDTSAKCFFFLWGTGDNGKSIFIETITRVMGDYGTQIEVESLMMQKEGQTQTNDIANLKGARFVSTSETEKNCRLSTARVKRLTGNDRLKVRFLYQEPFSFMPEFKLWMSGNHKPVLDGNDKAIFRRVHLIPFEVSIPKDQQIPATVMHEKLGREMPGILAWMIEGWKLYLKDGLKPPQAVVDAVEEYRDESDTFGKFLRECTETDQFGEASSKALYEAYCNWSRDMGEKMPLTRHRFGAALRERGFTSKHTRDGDNWQGLSVLAGLAQRSMTNYLQNYDD